MEEGQEIQAWKNGSSKLKEREVSRKKKRLERLFTRSNVKQKELDLVTLYGRIIVSGVFKIYMKMVKSKPNIIRE